MLTTRLLMASVALCAAAPAFSQTVVEEKDAIALETARQALDAARQKQLLDALAAIKQPTEGKATIAGEPAATAEGLMLSDYGMRKAAKTMADRVRTLGTGISAQSPLMVVIGGQAPSIAQWQSFDRMATLLEENLKQVAADWKTANAAVGEAEEGGTPIKIAMIPSGAALGIVSTVVSLLKTDYGIAGSKLAPTGEATRAIVVGALSEAGVAMAFPEYQIAITPTGIKTRLAQLEPLRSVALRLYHDDYLKQLAKAGGKLDKEPAKVAAGTNLGVVLADYDALVKSLYTPVGGVLPAVEVERQRLLAEKSAAQTILYVTSSSSNLSAVTRKGFLTGSRSTPASLRVSSSIDFVVVKGTSTKVEHVTFDTGSVPFDEVGFTGRVAKPK